MQPLTARRLGDSETLWAFASLLIYMNIVLQELSKAAREVRWSCHRVESALQGSPEALSSVAVAGDSSARGAASHNAVPPEGLTV